MKTLVVCGSHAAADTLHITVKDSPTRINMASSTTINFVKHIIRNGPQLKISDYVFCKE